MTKDEIKKLLIKESKDYHEIEPFDQLSGTLKDGTQYVIHFKDPERVIYKKDEELSDFNKKLKTALEYDPKDKKK